MTKATYNQDTKRVTLEIDAEELDSLLQLSEIGIRNLYEQRLANAEPKHQATVLALRKKALEDLNELNQLIANA